MTYRTLDEDLIVAWVKLTGALKNTRITQGMIYNEAIVMLIAYNRYREDGDGLISFKEIVHQTQMLKSLVNRTINSLVRKNLLERCEGKDKRVTFVRIVKDNLDDFLKVHAQSLALADDLIDIIGKEDAAAFVRISEKICKAAPLADRV